MYAVDAKRQYAEQAVHTVNPAQLVLLMYEAAVGAVEAADSQLRSPRADLGAVNHELGRAQQLLTELEVALDHERGGTIAESLQSLYAYARRKLVDANLAKDPKVLPEVKQLLTELRDAWAEGVVGGSKT